MNLFYENGTGREISTITMTELLLQMELLAPSCYENDNLRGKRTRVDCSASIVVPFRPNYPCRNIEIEEKDELTRLWKFRASWSGSLLPMVEVPRLLWHGLSPHPLFGGRTLDPNRTGPVGATNPSQMSSVGPRTIWKRRSAIESGHETTDYHLP